MNRVLARQLRRLGLAPDRVPVDLEDWVAFLDRVERHYNEADRSRYLLERSMEISAREMHELTTDIRELSRLEMARRDQLSQHNFNQLPVAAWLEDFTGVAERLDELRAAGLDPATEVDANPGLLRELVEAVVVLDVNPAVCELVGAERVALLGAVDASTLGTRSLESWQRQFEAICHGEGRVEVEFLGERSDGSEFDALLHWSVAQIDGVFDYSRVMVVVIDISDRIAAEQKMRELITAKDEFLASVSHELRTPLTSVIGYAEVLKSTAVVSGDHREMIDTIADQAADLANIVEDLLAGARAELGQLRVENHPVDVGDVIDVLLVSYPHLAPPELPAGGLRASADSSRVRQILRNLITNAERYGGPNISLQVEWGLGCVIVAVCDDGPAMEPEVADQIFDRYFRDQRASGRPGSVGIGLTISRELARLMGGDLTYLHDGSLARFELTLPAAQPELRAVG